MGKAKQLHNNISFREGMYKKYYLLIPMYKLAVETVKYKTQEGAPSVWLETDEKQSLVTNMVKIQ